MQDEIVARGVHIPFNGEPWTCVEVVVATSEEGFLLQPLVFRLTRLTKQFEGNGSQVLLVLTHSVDTTLAILGEIPAVACVSGLSIAHGKVVVALALIVALRDGCG